VSDIRAAGWDRPEVEVTERHLCSHHRASTEHLSTYHANQLAAACPWCCDPARPEPLWHNGFRVAETRRVFHNTEESAA
jgi:hypothetical protein